MSTTRDGSSRGGEIADAEPVCACCELADCANGRHCDGYQAGDVTCCGCGRLRFRWRHPIEFAKAVWGLTLHGRGS